MRANRSIPPAVVIPVLQYADVRAAVEWLTKAFGFRERMTIGTHRAQMTFAGGALVVHEGGPGEGPKGGGAHSVMVRVEDAGHNVHHDQPEELASIIEQFMTQ